jgi:L-lactate dehydrogenase complex protein LldG
MSARERILERVRAAARRRAPHPGPHPAPPLAGGAEAFGRALDAAGGALLGPVPCAALGGAVAELVRDLAVGERVVATRAATDWLRGAPFSFEVAADGAAPASFRDVGLAILRGEIAVAESGAVALLGAQVPQRGLAFLCAHLVLLVDRARLVPDLHTAVAALPPDALAHHHLTWVAGPSKTADIEQTLVIGAHGPLSLHVVLVDDPAP